MTGFDDYAALARQLHTQRRAGEAAAAEAVAQRVTLNAHLGQLDQRLAAQRQRLQHLARAIDQPDPGPVVAPAGDAVPAVPVNPAAELEQARHRADAADHAVLRVETLAQQPPLLPGWSPLARAFGVYGGWALIAVAAQFVLIFTSGVTAIDGFTFYSWMCAGLPAVAFFAGYLTLNLGGKPKMAAKAPALYAQLGFAICFIAMPTAYCGYLLLARA